MNILIPFSGGLDSTYLVYKTLKEGNNPILVYFEIINNLNKTRIELIHRKEIKKELEKHFRIDSILRKQIDIKDLEVQTKIEISGRVNESYILVQPPIWIYGIHSVSESIYDKIQIAYVLGDCAISYLEDIQNLYKAYTPFVRNKIDNLKPLEFPLIKYAKEEIANDLPDTISKLTWSCECPVVIFEDDNYFVYSNCNSKKSSYSCAACEHSPNRGKKYCIYRKKDLLTEEKRLIVLDEWDFIENIKQHPYLKTKNKIKEEANSLMDKMEMKNGLSLMSVYLTADNER